MSTGPNLLAATGFIWRTARLIDRFRFAYLFLEGKREPVLQALRAYQNADGGFGNALEPDLRCPPSQPVPVWSAFEVLDQIDAFADPMVVQACDYLTTITTRDGGVPFVLPSARDFPRAPWWETDANPPGSLNPTAALAAQLHKHRIEHRWLARATEFCWRKLEDIQRPEAYEMRALLPFLEQVPDRSRAERVFQRLAPKILEEDLVALDPSAAGEVQTPLDFAPRPDSWARRLFSDRVIDAHLRALAQAQKADGGWSFNWQDWNPTTGLEWRGWVTIEALRTLRAYGRLAT